MKHNIEYLLYIISASFLFASLVAINTPLPSQSQTLAYATTQQEQEEDQQEDLQTTSDTQESETNTGNIKSEQTEASGEDENNDEDSIKSEVGCSAVATNDPNYVYCNTQQPIQSQQTSQQPSLQNTPSNPSQNTFTAPTIDSDTSLSNLPNTETTIPTQKNFKLADQYRPGSGLTGLTIPGKSGNLIGPYTPGAGNEEVKGVGLAYLTVYPNSTASIEICAFISQPYEVQGNPYCIQTTGESTMHALQAPGLIGIKASGNVDKIDTSNCEFRIFPKQSKSCVLNIIDSPFIKLKSETTERDTTLSFNR